MSAVRVAVQLLELGEALCQLPVVAQVGKEREDALGRLLEVCAGRDQAREGYDHCSIAAAFSPA